MEMPPITMTPAASRSPITSEAGGATSNWVDVLALEFEGGEPFECDLLVYPSFESVAPALHRSTWDRVYIQLTIGRGVPKSGGEHKTVVHSLPSCGVRSRFPAKWVRLQARTQADPSDVAEGASVLSCFVVASASPVVGAGSPLELDAVSLRAAHPFGGGEDGRLVEIPKGAREARARSRTAGGVLAWKDPAGNTVGCDSVATNAWVSVPRAAWGVYFYAMNTAARAQVEFR